MTTIVPDTPRPLRVTAVPPRPGRPPQAPTRPPRVRRVRLGSDRRFAGDVEFPTPARPVPDRSSHDDAPLPDPTALCALVVRAAVEVLHGDRPAAQLARWVTPAVLDQLTTRARLLREAGETGTTATRPVRVRRVRLDPRDEAPSTPGVAECAVVVDDRDRVRAAAVRLEAHRGQWRVAVLEIG